MSDGTREVNIYHYAGNMHNPGLLMVHLPRERTLIEADSWSPPATAGDYPGAVANLVQFYQSVERLNLDVIACVNFLRNACDDCCGRAFLNA